jgi:hypothetical protein
MLLNLSNHPSHLWPQGQLDAATKAYGGVEDLPFPQIDPAIDRIDVAILVESYVSNVRRSDPRAVHLMGELTFCAQLALALHQIGILVVASTTRRNVILEADGVKTSKFEFVRFRAYF